MYGGPQPAIQPKTAKQQQSVQVTEKTGNIQRSPHQSMADMMTIVEDMYNGGGNNEPQSLIQTNTNTAPTENANRRTRTGNDQQNQGSGDGEQVKQAFKQWLQSFDQAVCSLDASDKSKGDAMWKDVVDCVDQCWKAYTEQGQID